MKPLISFAIPCYNSAAYMRHCIENLLTAKNRNIEILIVNDGSKDETPQIADEYAEKYPGIVKACHQVNKGHGGAVNTGMANATGTYFKVVDSDDWLDPTVLQRVLDILEKIDEVDMFIANYVYDKVGVKHKKIISYESYLPQNEVFGWDKARKLPIGTYILMHSVIYRLDMLKDAKLCLPEHTFYVDNIFVHSPLPYVKRLYYVNLNLYHYFIGRDDQSVNEQVMIKRLDQQMRVNKILIDTQVAAKDVDKHCYNYMYSYMTIITMITQLMLMIRGDDEAYKEIDSLWDYIKEADTQLYHKMRLGLVYNAFHIPTKAGKKIVIGIYHIAQKIYGFN